MAQPSKVIELHKPVVLDTVLDWMDQSFTGDLREAAATAAARAQQAGYVSGPLWGEIGASVLADLYRLRRIHPNRKQALTVRERGVAPEDLAPLAVWKSVGNRCVQLGDMIKADLRAVANYHHALSESNGFERDFYNALADGLRTDKQPVRDRYTPDDIWAIRKRLAARGV